MAMVKRRIAVVVPARNEAARIVPCLRRLTDLDLDDRVATITILVLANNCTDGTVEAVEAFAKREPSVTVEAVELETGQANAGWARRLAFDAGARLLSAPQDLLLCTDADTLVARDWLTKTLDHIDAGFDAVAGFARLNPRELRQLDPVFRKRLAAIRRYEDAFCYLKALQPSGEPWPRHFYEGGASIAVRLDAYTGIGGAPTPRVGEDKALFEALRSKGRRIRHARDVKVLTSCRLDGRAPDGAADTLARWGVQDEREGLWGLSPVAAALGAPGEHDEPLTLETLPAETEIARALVRAIRLERSLAKAS